jgi:hypothetical protein
MNVHFVSREPVRASQPIADFAAVARGLEKTFPGQTLAGSLSVSWQNRFVIALCPKGLGTAPESSMVELYEYDPVRYQSLVVGLVEPPASTPVHWICRRVNPEARVVAVVDPGPEVREGVEVVPAPKGYLGNTDTLLTLGKILKGKSLQAIESVGLIASAPGADELSQALVSGLKPKSK